MATSGKMTRCGHGLHRTTGKSHPFDKFNDSAVATELLANLHEVYEYADQTQGYDGVVRSAGSGRKREAACPDHERFCGTLC